MSYTKKSPIDALNYAVSYIEGDVPLNEDEKNMLICDLVYGFGVLASLHEHVVNSCNITTGKINDLDEDDFPVIENTTIN